MFRRNARGATFVIVLVFVLVFVLVVALFVVGESDERCREAAIEATRAGIGIASRFI
jgi:Tfp pilus assembly protein PilX